MDINYVVESLKLRHAKIKRQYLPDSLESPYVSEIVVYMKKLEIERFGKISLSPQISWRSHLVNWIFTVASELKVGANAIHLAVKLLDGFMSGHNIEVHRLNFVSIGCLLIASKFEEKDSKVPKLKTVCAFLPNDVKIILDEYRCLEEMVLKYFKWNINIPTTSHFLEIFLPYSTSYELDDLNIFQQEYGFSHEHCSQNMKEKLLDVISAFSDASLQETCLMSKFPSRVASAIIFCSRQICNIHPAWSDDLKNITGLLKSQFEDCITILQNSYDVAVKSSKKKMKGLDFDEEISPRVRSGNKRTDGRKVRNRNRRKPKLDQSNYAPPKVPIIDLDDDSSDINDDNREVTIVEISPDDGYSSMGSNSSSGAYNLDNAISKENRMCKKVEFLKESKQNDQCDGTRPRKKHKNNIEANSVMSPDYPWYLRTNDFKKNICSKNSDHLLKDENVRHLKHNRCKKNLKFDNTNAPDEDNNKASTISERSSKNSPGYVFREEMLNNEVIIIKETISNKNKIHPSVGHKLFDTNS